MVRAVQFVGPNELRVADVDASSPRTGEVIVASRAVGICHSDFELLSGQYIIPFEYPVTPGHEWSGEVVEVADGVEGFAPGDRVVGECVVGPGGRDHFGFNIDGAAAETFVVRGEWLHRIPDELTDTHGALVEPFSVAYNALRHVGGLDPSDHVAVVGGGPIGLLCVMAASATNARVTLVEPQSHRRELGLRVGAGRAIDPTTETFTEEVAEVTGGRGFDAVIEAAGAPLALAETFRLATHGGRIAFVGIDIGSEPSAALGLIQSKALTVRGLIGSMGVWPQTIRFLASGFIDPSVLVTAEFGLEDAADAFAAARQTDENIKVHIRVES